MALTKEKNFGDVPLSVFRRGCGLGSIRKAQGSIGSGESVEPAWTPSDLTIRATLTLSIVWTTGQSPPNGSTPMRWNDLLVFDYIQPPPASSIYSQQVSAGLTSGCQVVGAQRPMYSQISRAGLNIFSGNPFANWSDSIANYTFKVVMLFWMDTSLLSSYKVKASWRHVSTYATAILQDSALDLGAYYGYILKQMTTSPWGGGAYGTFWRIPNTKLEFGYSYTLSQVPSLTWYRRTKDATDEAWFTAQPL